MSTPDPAVDPGPYFDDLTVGQVLDPAPAITIDEGEAAVYQAICGDPLAMALSAPLSEDVTGTPGRLVNPALVMHISIGQSTVATQRVVANLFYRGVVLGEAVRLGETLQTTVEIRGLRETTRREDRPPRGLALLGIRTVRVDDDTPVVDYERCAMLKFRDEVAKTGHIDELGGANPQVDLSAWADRVPLGWDPSPLAAVDMDWNIGETRVDLLRDTVTAAPELARLSQNLAPVHRDAAANEGGRRLVYGGHTIGLAQASLVRRMPGIATVLGWQSCEHPGPVFEGDVLSCRHSLLDEQEAAGGHLRAVRTEVSVERDGTDGGPVLDWRLVTWGA